MDAARDFRQEFLAFALSRDVLRFGDFVTKAGRRTPYFFNAGLFDGLHHTILASRVEAKHAPYYWQYRENGWSCSLV